MQADRATAPRGLRFRIASFAMTLLAVAPMAFAQAPPAAGGTLDRIRETGRIRLGFRADAQPISFKDASGAAAGYAVDLCVRIAEAVKGELGLASPHAHASTLRSAPQLGQSPRHSSRHSGWTGKSSAIPSWKKPPRSISLPRYQPASSSSERHRPSRARAGTRA